MFLYFPLFESSDRPIVIRQYGKLCEYIKSLNFNFKTIKQSKLMLLYFLLFYFNIEPVVFNQGPPG